MSTSTNTIGNDRGLENISAPASVKSQTPKIVAIMPAYNASRTLEQTFRAFGRSLLVGTPFLLNSSDFIFDQEIVAHAVWFGTRIEEISVPHRYFPEASTIGFGRSVRYGLGVLALLAIFVLNRAGLMYS